MPVLHCSNPRAAIDPRQTDTATIVDIAALNADFHCERPERLTLGIRREPRPTSLLLDPPTATASSTFDLRMHEVIPTVDPVTGLAVGLKVDVEALPAGVVAALRASHVDLTNPAVTIELLRLNAVVGVKADLVDYLKTL